MRTLAPPNIAQSAGIRRRGTRSLASFRAEIVDRLALTKLPESLCRAISDIHLPAEERILYQVGKEHFAWVHLFRNGGNETGYRALVTMARKVRLQNSKECVLCASADDVVAALLAEVRRLRQFGVL